MREARFCWACGSKMQDRNISVDAEWGKYTITINGMKAQECSECRETVISADELLTLREMGLSLFVPQNDDKEMPERLSESEGSALKLAPEQPVKKAVESSVYDPVEQPKTNSTDKLDEMPHAKDKAVSTLIGVKEAAELLKVSKHTVYRMVHQKTLPAIKIGNAWKFREEDIAILLEKT